eukprot:767579-Hanusia_phi.AAC.9
MNRKQKSSLQPSTAARQVCWDQAVLQSRAVERSMGGSFRSVAMSTKGATRRRPHTPRAWEIDYCRAVEAAGVRG